MKNRTQAKKKIKIYSPYYPHDSEIVPFKIHKSYNMMYLDYSGQRRWYNPLKDRKRSFIFNCPVFDLSDIQIKKFIETFKQLHGADSIVITHNAKQKRGILGIIDKPNYSRSQNAIYNAKNWEKQ